MSRAVVLSAVRTPVGRYGGALSGSGRTISPRSRSRRRSNAPALRPARSRTSTSAARTRPARTTATSRAWPRCSPGCPESVAGVTVNRLCASGLAAVVSACHAVCAGDGDLFVAGGVESMSRAPLAMAKPDSAFPRGNQVAYDTTLGWRFPNPRMEEMFPLESMGETGENVAERWQRLTRGSGRVCARVAAALGGGERGGPVRRRTGRRSATSYATSTRGRTRAPSGSHSSSRRSAPAAPSLPATRAGSTTVRRRS